MSELDSIWGYGEDMRELMPSKLNDIVRETETGKLVSQVN